MNKINQRQKWFFTLFLVFAFLINGLPLRAQDVVTSEDFTGGSSAFVFKGSRRAVQKKIAFRVTTNISRTKIAKLELTKRIAKQFVAVVKVNPKRTRSKEVNPNSLERNTVAFKRKTAQETSVIFAGVGEYYLKIDDVDKAVDFFRESAQLDDKNTNAKNGLSEAVTRKGNQLLVAETYDIAKLLFDEAVKNNPKNAGAFAGLAEIYSAQNDNESATSNYEKALNFDAELTELNAPLGVLYFQKGEIAKAETYLQKAVSANPDNAETQFFLGLVRSKQDRNEEAATAFKRSIELDPNNPQVHYFLAGVYDRLNRDKETIDEYQKAVQLDPKYAEAWFDLGVAFYSRDRLPEAINAYKEAIKIKPTYGEAHANLADVYRLSNQFDEAIGEYRLATTFIKDDAELLGKFGYVAARRAANPSYSSFWKTAIDNFEKAIAISPDYIDYTNLGWAYYNSAQVKGVSESDRKAKLEKARDAFVKAISLKPIDKVAAAVNLNLGMTYTDLGDFSSAISALKMATDLQKNWTPAFNELGIAYRKNNDFENAAKQFRKAIETDDKFAAAHYNLGETEFRRGNLKEAKKEYEKLKSMNQPKFANLLIAVTNGGVLK
jgi:superkiller protein 3